MNNLGAIASRFLSILIVLQVLGNTILLKTYLSMAPSGETSGDSLHPQVVVLMVVISLQFGLAFLLWVNSDRFAPSENLGAIASRVLSMVFVGHVFDVAVAAPNYLAMAQMTRRPGDEGLRTELIGAALVVAFEVCLSLILWFKADRFVPSTSLAASGSVDTVQLKRILFCALGVYLLAGSLTSLATELAAAYTHFAPMRISHQAWMPSGWIYLEDVLRATVGIGLVLFNRPLKPSHGLS